MARDQADDIADLRRIAGAIPGVWVWDPAEVLCKAGDCALMHSGDVLYSDWHHLSPAGSAWLGHHAAELLSLIAKRDDHLEVKSTRGALR